MVWETSSTPDTYYSCSDLVDQGGRRASADRRRRQAVEAGHQKAAPKPIPLRRNPARSRRPGRGRRARRRRRTGTAKEAWLRPAAAQADDRVQLGHQILIAALVVILGVSAGAGFMRLRAARTQGNHFSPRR